MTPSIPHQKRSLDLAHQLALGLLAHLDLSRHPIRQVDKGRLLKTADSQLDALPYIESGRLDAVLQVGEEGNQVIPVTQWSLALAFNEIKIPARHTKIRCFLNTTFLGDNSTSKPSAA